MRRWLFLLPLACAGCADPTYIDRTGKGSAPGEWSNEVIFHVHDAFARTPPDCVAILPFKAGDGVAPKDAARVRLALYAHLAPQGRREVPLPRIDDVLGRLSPEDRADPRKVGQAVHCSAVMTGTVTDSGSAWYGVYSRVAVGADLTMVRAADGAPLWQGRHLAAAHGGTIPLSPVGVAMGVLDAAENVRDEQILRLTDDLARRLATTIPDTYKAPLDDPQPQPVRIAEAADGRGAMAERGRVLRAEAARDPRSADAQLRLGQWAMEAGDYPQATAAAEQAIALDGKLAEAHFLKARLLMRDGAYDAAEPAILKAVALDRRNSLYLNGLGYLNGRRGRDDRALAAYRMAVDRQPTDGFAWYNMGVLYARGGQGKDAADAFYAAGLAYLKTGDYGRAQKALGALTEMAGTGLALDAEIGRLRKGLEEKAVLTANSQ